MDDDKEDSDVGCSSMNVDGRKLAGVEDVGTVGGRVDVGVVDGWRGFLG